MRPGGGGGSVWLLPVSPDDLGRTCPSLRSHARYVIFYVIMTVVPFNEISRVKAISFFFSKPNLGCRTGRYDLKIIPRYFPTFS